MAEVAQTEFNSNVEVLRRLSQYLLIANEYSEQDNLVYWFKQLEKIRRDVIIKLKHKKCDEGKCARCSSEKTFKNLKKTIRVHKIHRDDEMIATKLKEDLDEYQIMLMDIMDERGMLLRNEDQGMEIPDEW